MLQAATAMLASGGEDALQMKELAERAAVSLATLYRYFPSKDHLLLAISHSRYENAFRRVSSEPARGATVQERVTNHLLREFRAEQRDQQLTAALTRVLSDTRPEYAPVIIKTMQLHLQVLEHVATAGGPRTALQHAPGVGLRHRAIGQNAGAPDRRAEQRTPAIIGNFGGLDVVLQVGLEMMVTGHRVFLAAFFVQTDPEAAMLPEHVGHGHTERRADAREGKNQQANQCPVAQAHDG